MASVRNKDTKPEVLLRSWLWKAGLRYRKNWGGLEGHPDIVFVRPKVAVFVDGDFWHGNAWRLRGLPSLEELFPTRREWWVEKIQRNIERDREVTAALVSEGWTVLRYWRARYCPRLKRLYRTSSMPFDERRKGRFPRNL